MMNNSFFEDILSEKSIKIVGELFLSEVQTFSQLAQVARLDVRRELQHADLSDVCFDDSDLRNFNFTGADLRGATGRNVVWDDTTILTDADVSGSIFAYELSKREFFAREPTWHGLYLRKRKEHWASNAL